MRRDLDALARGTFDIAVIGGGITGLCVAHDATLRGLSVALVEKDDFGHGTSAASSKLLHGGIRYLQQAQFAKVRESASERAHFLRIAPHLVRWVPFLIPTTAGLSKGRLLLGAGIRAYHALVSGTSAALRDPALTVPEDYFLERSEICRHYPLLESLSDTTGAWVIHEAHMHSSERMSLAFAKSAAARGARLANYAPVVGLERERGRVVGVVVRDLFTNRTTEIASKLVVNAAGPWIGSLNRPEGLHLERDITGFAKGVHIVTRPLLPDVAVAIATRHRNQAVIQRGGRHFFIIPWRGCSLIGTTNVPFSGTPDEVAVRSSDVSTFLDDINEALPAARLTPDQVRFAFAGVYPLTENVIRPEVYQGTGRYQLVDHAAHDGVEGIVSVLGAKFTTARRLAGRTVDLVARKLRTSLPACATADTPLIGGAIDDIESFRRDAIARHRDVLDEGTLLRLVSQYGSELPAFLSSVVQIASWNRYLGNDRQLLEGEVHFAVDEEMAMTLSDVVFRRTGLGTIGHPGADTLERCARIMADKLAWNAAETDRQLRETTSRFTTV